MSGAQGALGLSLQAARPRWLWGAAAGLLLALGAVLGAWRWRRGAGRRRRFRLQRVGTVLKLYVYPVKSFRGLTVPQARVTLMGLQSGELRDRYGGGGLGNGVWRGAPARPSPAIGPPSGSAVVGCSLWRGTCCARVAGGSCARPRPLALSSAFLSPVTRQVLACDQGRWTHGDSSPGAAPGPHFCGL